MWPFHSIIIRYYPYYDRKDDLLLMKFLEINNYGNELQFIFFTLLQWCHMSTKVTQIRGNSTVCSIALFILTSSTLLALCERSIPFPLTKGLYYGKYFHVQLKQWRYSSLTLNHQNYLYSLYDMMGLPLGEYMPIAVVFCKCEPELIKDS